jgi:RNA polymerase sigma-70 factor (ECF subfamily)
MNPAPDLDALGRMLDEHRPSLLAMLRRRLCPALSVHVDAEDVLHDVFLLARRKWDWFCRQHIMQPYPWLYRLALDCLSAQWRRLRGGRQRCMPLPEDSSAQLGLGLVSAETSPSASVAQAELQQQMRQALALLKDGDREVLWMRHYDLLSFAEVGQVFGVSENAATLRYVRALRRLKDLWQQLHPDQETPS